jgi:hypothetical protein
LWANAIVFSRLRKEILELERYLRRNELLALLQAAIAMAKAVLKFGLEMPVEAVTKRQIYA